jgi:thiol:disulfide interchange protein DsbA
VGWNSADRRRPKSGKNLKRTPKYGETSEMKMKILLPLLLLLVVAMPVSAEEFVEGEHYFSVFRERPPTDPARVEVDEFFWYACPHCYNLEPHIKGWLKNKPENVDFVRVPAMFERANVIMHAKTFYALESMKVDWSIHDAIFSAMHDDHRHLNSQEEMEELLEELDVDVEAYRKAMKGFSVNVKANQAKSVAEDFEINGVPSLVVGGKYRTRSFDGPKMIELLDFLIKKVAAEQMALKAAE